MLVKRDSTSKLATNNQKSCSVTSLANSKLFLMVNLLVVIVSEIGTKCLAILKDRDSCQWTSCEFYKDHIICQILSLQVLAFYTLDLKLPESYLTVLGDL